MKSKATRKKGKTRRRYTPYEVKKREKESLLNFYRLERGKLWRELEEELGIHTSRMVGLSNGMICPVVEIGDKKGQLKKDVIDLCKYFRVDPSQMFPRYLCRIDNKDESEEDVVFYDFQISQFTLSAATGHDGMNEERNRFELLKNSSRWITAREDLFLKRHFVEDMGLDEIGKEFGISKSMVGMIITRATRKIRNTLMRKYWNELSERELMALLKMAVNNDLVSVSFAKICASEYIFLKCTMCESTMRTLVGFYHPLYLFGKRHHLCQSTLRLEYDVD